MGEAEVALRLAIGRLYFLLLPILTVAWLGVTFAVQEPFPTLVMPGFGRSPEISELTTFERSVFLVGDDADDRSEVTSLEFSNLDFTQSQSLPLIDGIQRELPDLDPELQAWMVPLEPEVVGGVVLLLLPALFLRKVALQATGRFEQVATPA